MFNNGDKCINHYNRNYWKLLLIVKMIDKGEKLSITSTNYFIYFYFMSLFILLTHRKATKSLIHRVSSYPNLLLEMPRYCCLFEI